MTDLNLSSGAITTVFGATPSPSWSTRGLKKYKYKFDNNVNSLVSTTILNNKYPEHARATINQFFALWYTPSLEPPTPVKLRLLSVVQWARHKVRPQPSRQIIIAKVWSSSKLTYSLWCTRSVTIGLLRAGRQDILLLNSVLRIVAFKQSGSYVYKLVYTEYISK